MSARDRPPSDVLMDPPRPMRATDVKRGEISPLEMMIGFHALAECGGDLDGCQMPYLHSYLEAALDLNVSVGHKNSKLYSETVGKEHWEAPVDRSEWNARSEKNGRAGLPRAQDHE